MKEKTAKVVRIITVPPVLACILFVVLAARRPDLFLHRADLAMALICLCLIPTLAYPCAPLFPKLGKDRRQVQRKLAFIFSFSGYLILDLYGFLSRAGGPLQMVFNTYMLSVLLLILFNKGLKMRASGHACSATSPLVFIIYFVGTGWILPCLLIGALIVWSSLTLKRHTVLDLSLGCLVCLVSFGLCRLLLMAA